MSAASLRTFRYLRSWLTGRADVRVREVLLDRAGTTVPAWVLTPGQAPAPVPYWVVLHGITRPGRNHAQLQRFIRAVAEGGRAVIVPDIPEWRELELAPEVTVPTILACMERMEALPGLVAQAPPALMGFSFGAPQVLAASSDPRLHGRLAGIAAFGGYCDLERTLVFQFTGTHGYAGETHTLTPDPYGRWISGANYLTLVPGYSGAEDVAAGLRRLATLAGDTGVVAWDPCFDPAKERIRAALPGPRRELFDLFAPPSDRNPDPIAGEALARLLAAAAKGADLTTEPEAYLPRVQGPVHLLHGRGDRLIPFTEMLRLRDAMPRGILARSTVTRLFAHSYQDPLPGWVESVREGVDFLKALSGVLGLA